MQTNPEKGNNEHQREQSKERGIGSDISKGRQVQQDSENQAPGTDSALKASYLLIIWSWLRRKFWDSWHFDESPSVFEALTFMVSAIGVAFLIRQIGQTDAALEQAREANRIARTALTKAEADSKDDDARYREQFQLARQNAQAVSESANAARISADSSRLQTSAAHEANQLARDQFFLTQRPWVRMEPITPTLARDKEPPNSPWFINFRLVNNGLTPAFRGTQTVKGFKVVDNTIVAISEFLKSFSVPALQGGDRIYLPNEDIIITLPMNITDDQLARINRREAVLYVFARVDYGDVRDRDSQPPRRPYTTIFCRHYNPQGLPWSPCDDAHDVVR